MKEKRITLETAMIAKEKGYDIPSRYGYNLYVTTTPELIQIDNENRERNWNISIGASYTAPTQSALAKWLREKYGIHIIVRWDYSYSSKREYYFVDGRRKAEEGILLIQPRENSFSTYEEAMEIGLQEGLKRI